MGCCNTCGIITLKIILSILNILFLIAGVCLLTAGIIFLVDPTLFSYLQIADLSGDGDLSQNIAIVMIVIGSIMTLICIFGSFGACLGNTCMLTTYCILIGITICAQFAFGIFLLVEDEWLGDQLEDGMNDFVTYEFLGANENAISESWETTQIELQCCGVNGPEDYLNSRWINETDTDDWSYPKTCCVLTNTDPKNPLPENPQECKNGNPDHLYTTGCVDDLRDWLETWNAAIAGSVMAYAFLQVILIAFACCLTSGIQSERNVDIYKNGMVV